MSDHWTAIPDGEHRRCQNHVGPQHVSVAVLNRCKHRARWLYAGQHAVCTFHKNHNYSIGEWDGETGVQKWFAATRKPDNSH